MGAAARHVEAEPVDELGRASTRSRKARSACHETPQVVQDLSPGFVDRRQPAGRQRPGMKKPTPTRWPRCVVEEGALAPVTRPHKSFTDLSPGFVTGLSSLLNQREWGSGQAREEAEPVDEALGRNPLSTSVEEGALAPVTRPHKSFTDLSPGFARPRHLLTRGMGAAARHVKKPSPWRSSGPDPLSTSVEEARVAPVTRPPQVVHRPLTGFRDGTSPPPPARPRDMGAAARHVKKPSPWTKL